MIIIRKLKKLNYLFIRWPCMATDEIWEAAYISVSEAFSCSTTY